jgi:hypothetical protein
MTLGHARRRAACVRCARFKGKGERAAPGLVDGGK